MGRQNHVAERANRRRRRPGTHRIYFLLGPGTSIPPVVRLARRGASTAPLEVKTLPAIFPAELGLRGTAAGRRGILHTRYAKQRLAALQDEIEREMRTNGEGIGLEIAVQEKQWLVENFGVSATKLQVHVPDAQHPRPATPRSPTNCRISDRLKGLKLGTSASDLAGSTTGTSAFYILRLSREYYIYTYIYPGIPYQAIG